MVAKRRWAVLLIFVCLFVSCSSYKSLTQQNGPTYPDMELKKATYTFKQTSREPLILYADLITVWPDGTTDLENVSFSQSEDGEKELWGSCEKAESVNENIISMSGQVQLFRKTDNIEIVCDNLEWNDQEQKISAKGPVYVKYQDGTGIQAEDFTADLGMNDYSFGKILEGRYEN